MTDGAGDAARARPSGAAEAMTDGLAQVTALLSAEGQELLARVAAARAAGEPPLALASRLRRDYPAGLVAAATAQDELRRAAAGKFSRAGQMLFTRPGLEQASSETAARHRARRLAGATAGRLADLACGIGGDLIALAAGREVLAVDRDAVPLRMAAHNAGVYDVAAGVVTCEADVRDVSLDGIGAVFADPARRLAGAAGSRRLRPGDSEPPLAWCFALTSRAPRGSRQGRARPARRDRPGRLGNRVRGGRPGPEGGGAVVARPRHGPGPRDDPPRGAHAAPRAQEGARADCPGNSQGGGPGRGRGRMLRGTSPSLRRESSSSTRIRP